VTHPRHSSPNGLEVTRAEAERAVTGRTVCGEFLRTVAAQSGWLALRGPDGAGGWRDYTWADYAEQVARVAGGMRRLGVAEGEPVAVLCRDRPEFHFVDTGTMFAGGTPISLNDAAPADQIASQIQDSRAGVVVVEDIDLLARLHSVAHRLPRLRKVVLVEPCDQPGGTDLPDPVITLDELVSGPPLALADAAAQVDPRDPATVTYTAGTSGEPEGVVLTHHDICYAVHVHFHVMGRRIAGLRQLSYLPMAHVGARDVTHYFHMFGGTVLGTCADRADLGEVMRDVRPQLWFCSPRMWEELRAGIEARVLTAPAPMRRQFEAALELGWRMYTLRNDGAPVPDELAWTWDEIHSGVISPLLFEIGLDDVVLASSGAASLAPETWKFFQSCGLRISDADGSLETAGSVSSGPAQ
jgi:long-chain acyl-CoA synthetase